MSEISLYPQGIDMFTTKVDSTGEDDDYYIYAEHVNKIQNAIIAIERSLGTSPQGELESVADRLFSITRNKTLAIPRITIYNGNPISINGSTSKEEAARYFSYFSTVLLKVADPFDVSMSDVGLVIEETLKISLTSFYGTIDAGVSTSNLPLLDIGNIIDQWVEQGVEGVYFKNFGYDFGVSRTRQNELVALARGKGISIIVSSTNIEHVFSTENLIEMNPSNIPMSLTSSDGYLFLGYALKGSSYQNAAELKDLSNKMITYRSAYGVSMYGLGYIYSGDEVLKSRMYYYGQTTTVAYSLNGFHAVELTAGQTFDDIPQNTLQYFKALPIMGNYYDANPVISTNGDVVYRITEIGKVTVNLSTHSYSFDNLKIPLGFIDFNADDTKIDTSKLTGTLSQDIIINMIARINSDASGLTISSDKIDISGTKAIDAINLVANGSTKINSNAIDVISSAHIEEIIIETMADQLELELTGGTLTANFRKLLAQFISAQNAYFIALTGETGTFSGLNAGVLTTGFLTADVLKTNTITSDKLTIHANGGVNKWVGTAVSKTSGAKTPVYSDIFGKDVAVSFETVDNNILVTSDSIGSSRTNYVVLLETSVLCKDVYTWAASFTANSNAKLVVNGSDVVSCTAGQNVAYNGSFIKGWNRVQIYQDHNNETSCSVNIGIKFSIYSLEAETLKDAQGNPILPGLIKIQRVDAYADRATQIIGDVIKTGTLDATKIIAGTITANEIAANAITAVKINADAITTEKIAAGAITADEIATDAITTDKILAGAITANEIATGTILAGNISAGAITADQIATNAITTIKILADSITTEKIAASAITATEIAADAVTTDKIFAGAITATEIATNAVTAVKINADAVTAGKIAADAITAREIQTSAITTNKLAADSVTAVKIAADAVIAGKIDVDAITAREIQAGAIGVNELAANSVVAAKIAAGVITTDKLDAQEVVAGLVNAGVVQAIEASIQHLTSTSGEFETLLADLLTTKFIDASNIKIISEANDGTNTGALVIDNGGLVVASLPKTKIAISNEVMTNVSSRVYRVVSKYLTMPICETPAPTFSLKDITTQVVTPLTRGQYALIYEYGQITIDASVSLVNKNVISSYSYPAEYYPSGSRVVKMDREGIKISSDGGRLATWQTKLDGARLYVGEADISNASITNAHIKDGTIQTAKIGDAQITNAKIDTLSATKLTAGTIDASVITVINLNASNITTGSLSGINMSIGSANAVFKSSALGIHLGNAIFASAPFSVDMNGNMIATNATISGTVTATTGSKIANWNIGVNAISDTGGKVVIDSSVPSININSGAVIIGNYDGTNYGIKALSGKIGTLDITSTGVTGTGFAVSGSAISLSGAGAVIIDAGTLIVKNGANTYLTLGHLSTSPDIYGMKVAMTGSAYVQLDQNGLRSYNGTTNTINVGSDGNVTITGIINANSGSFTGDVNITGSGRLVAGTNILSATGLTIAAGTIALGSKFSVSVDGTMSASGGTFSGAITATSGTFTGDVLVGTAGSVHIDGVNKSIRVNTNDVVIDTNGISIAKGSLNLGSGLFQVTNAGALTATSGSIAGWSLGANDLYKGNIHLDTTNNAIWIGSSFATANIILNNSGVVKIGGLAVDASGNATLTGTVNATGGYFGTATNGVGILSTGIQINGTGDIRNSNTKLVGKTLTVYSGASYTTPEITLGEYTTGNFGIQAGTTILNKNGLTMSQGSISLGTTFSVTNAGVVTATSGTIAGWTINASSIKNSDSTFILDSANNRLSLGSGKILLNADGSATIGKLAIGIDGSITSDHFSISGTGDVSLTGAVVAESGSFTGTINATAGWFGTLANHVSISGNGLTAGSVVIDNTGIKIASTLSLTSAGLIITSASESSINLGGKFIANSSGITATAGTIAGWTIASNDLYKGNIHLDTTNNSIWIGTDTLPLFANANIKLNSDGSAKLGKISVSAVGAISSTNFNIDVNGNVTMAGTVNATGGYFGDATNGVGITTTGIQINGTGDIKNANTKLVGKTLTVYSGASYTVPEVIVGEYSTDNFGIQAGTTVLNSSGLIMSQGSISLGTTFSVTNGGAVSATSGTIGGWTLSSSDLYNGNIHIDKGNTAIWIGAALGTANIRLNADGSATIGKLSVAANGTISTAGGFSVNASGQISATQGTIGGFTIAANTLTAGNIIIDSTAAAQKISIGTNIVLNNNGSATLGKFSIATTGAISTIGGFSVDANGVMTATSGKVGNWSIAANALSAGTINIDATSGTEHIDIGTKILLNSVAVGNSTIGAFTIGMTSGTISTSGGFSVDGTTGKLTASLGTIGGWNLTSSTIYSIGYTNLVVGGDFAVDSNTDGVADGWGVTASMGTKSISGGIQKMTATAIGASFGSSVTNIVGHIYYYAVEVKASSPLVQLNNGYEVISHTGSGNFEKLSYVRVAGSTAAPHLGLYDDRASGWTEIQVRKPIFIDLTATYGTGLEPNKAWCDSNITFVASSFTNASLDSINHKLSFNNSAAVFGQYAFGKYGMQVGNFIINGTDSQIYVGANYAAANFKIDLATGNATLANATISGSITATVGTIGGFTVGTSTIYANTNSVILDSSNYKLSFNNGGAIFGQYTAGKYGMQIGNFVVNGTDSTISAGAKFSINIATGVATLDAAVLTNVSAATGTIGGWTAASGKLTGGTVTLDSTGSIKVTKTGDATKYTLIDGTGLNVVGGLVNIVTGINSTDNVTIDSTGIKAGGSTVYAKLDYTGLTVAGGAINITTAISGTKKLEIKSSGIIAYKDATNRVEIDGDGIRVIKNGSTLGAAITPDGIIGALLTDQSVAGSKFDKTAPAVPTNVDAVQVIEQTATSEFINLNVTWTAVTDTDLEGYKVYLKEGTGLYMPMSVVQKTQISYTIRNVKGATQYYVAVSAYDVTGNESALSTNKAILTTKDTVAPGVVTGLSYVDGPKMFYVKWNVVATNTDTTTCVDIDYYEVQRKTEQFGSIVEDWTLIYKGYSTSFIDKSVAYEYDYTYRVRAVDLSGNQGAWAQVAVGKASKIGAADIVAGSITADVLNIGSMVKGINPNKTILFHYDGVTTSTQDLRPIEQTGGSWVDGKYGDAVALEEATTNIISTLTNGNASFKNGTTLWVVNGAEYVSSGGFGGSNDGYVSVTSTNKISITVSTAIGSKYTISLYAKLAVFTEPSKIIAKTNTTTAIDTSLTSEWRRIYYVYTASSASTILEFASDNAYHVCIDNIQVEARDFMTAFTDSYNTEGTRLEGRLQYSSEKLNPLSGIVSMWYRPNRVNGSSNTTGQVLFLWGTEPNNYYKLEVTDDNKPKWTMVSQGVTRTITHQSVIDAFAWNQITVRWSYDPVLVTKFAELYLNGTPVEVNNRIDLTAFTNPSFGNAYFTIGNNNNGGQSCNGYIDEIRLDIEALLDNQEREEIISWYKQGSTFYDVASQIDADSQGISAANAKVRINNEGITVQDGVIKVISDDGIILIGGGRLNVNGMNVGVVQSDNEVYNGNFCVTDSIYSSGDIYTTTGGIENYGAKFWKIKRSSPGQYQTAVIASIWNTCFLKEVLDFPTIYTELNNQYRLVIRAQEAATHQIETIIRATPPISLMPEGAAKEIVVADTLEDELVFQIEKATNDKYDEWINKGIAFEMYGDVNGNTVIKAIRYDTDTQALQYLPSTIDIWTGKVSIEVDPATLSPIIYEGSEENGTYGHTIFEVRPQENVMGRTGYARIGANPIHQKPTIALLGVGDGTTTVFNIPLADMPIAAISSITVDGVQKVFSVNYVMDVQLGTVTFLPGSIPALGKDVIGVYNTIDMAAQEVSLEQDLLNLITYTDGLEPEETNWKQHIFTFYGKWDNKPVGSQSKLFFEVDELAPSSYDHDTGEKLPMISIVTTDAMTTQNDFIMGNTDFVAGKYGSILGHVTWPLYHLNHKTYILDSVRYATILPTLKVRYIRDYANGSTLNVMSHWVEIAALNMVGTDVALGQTVTSNFVPDTLNGSPLTALVNGVMTDWTGSPFSVAGTYYVQVDLGSVQTLGAITVWHYYSDGRTYHNTRTQVSEDGIKWYDVYNSDYQGEYTESPTGHTIGGLTGMTPNPILVEEIYFDDTGMTLAEKNAKRPQWIIRNDGALVSGSIDSKYIASTSSGDLMMTSFSSDSNIDTVMNFIKSAENGLVVLFVDGVFFSAADVSYPIPEAMQFSYDDMPFGNHVATLITTGDVGFNTDTVETPKFMLDSLYFYSWQSLGSDYITSVEYIEEDVTIWNKVTIVPNKTNTKELGVPRITTSNVPIKYRVRAKFVKPINDPFPASAIITSIQGERGQNESFSRVNYGPNSIPGYMIQPFSQFLVRSGITSKQLQNYAPYLDEESGIQERHIADRQVTTSKLAYEAVTGMNIANYNISMDKLAFKNRQIPVMNPSLDSYSYPIILPVNVDPKVLYITESIDIGSENVYVRGQLQWPGEDYTIEEVVAAVATTDVTVQEFATKITFLRDIGVGDRVWLDYWLPTLPVT